MPAEHSKLSKPRYGETATGLVTKFDAVHTVRVKGHLQRSSALLSRDIVNLASDYDCLPRRLHVCGVRTER
jgi:hypothetical protein